ncbi:MAG: winged helix-turn-helix transcriptional regulator [Asgard group archaeon]|nr:winged helix-turn-helix transcriptional regulator [Asgard group archaeon]
MNAVLNNEDFAILLALESNPSMPMTELATILNVTRITAKKRVDDLKERGIIREPIAIYDPYKLDLYRMNVLANVPTLDALEKLEKACDEHPYTHYRVRSFGCKFQLFMQFDMPNGTDKLLVDFLKQLEKQEIINSFELFPSKGLRTDVYADLSRFNAKLSSWNFSWEDWYNKLGTQTSKLPPVAKSEVDYTNFNKSYFQVLRLLTANATLKQTDLIEKLKLSKTQAHREYNFVMENFIETIRFMYDREIFDLTETYIAIGYNISSKLIAQIYHAINNNPPPFRLALDILENDSILLWGNMSPAQASGFAFSMWKFIPDMNIYTLDTKKSRLYWFYPDNFDFDKLEWKISKDYFITEPLDRVLK